MYNVKKWAKMLCGKSISHVNQGIGKIYSLHDIKGYYNDLTEKVTKDKNYNNLILPMLKIENGTKILFPIDIFQYGLGSYDLYLLKKKKIFLKKFKLCTEWAIDNQELNGSWNTFFFKQPEAPYSSMAQGEGISLLLRAYKEFHDPKCLKAAKKAIKFMIAPLDDGGTARYVDEEVYFQEYTNKPTVLNGWIFSLFGLYDYLKIVNDDKIKDIYDKSIRTLINRMEDYDNFYWSKYDIDKMLASPFYHKLHIAQLEVMHNITGEKIFGEYAKKWENYTKNPFNRIKAFAIKAYQKIIE